MKNVRIKAAYTGLLKRCSFALFALYLGNIAGVAQFHSYGLKNFSVFDPTPIVYAVMMASCMSLTVVVLLLGIAASFAFCFDQKRSIFWWILTFAFFGLVPFLSRYAFRQ